MSTKKITTSKSAEAVQVLNELAPAQPSALVRAQPSGQLSHQEEARLAELETQIDTGLRGLVDGIVEIHAKRPYRQFGTFGQYIEKRWKRTAAWAYDELARVGRQNILTQAGLDTKLKPSQSNALRSLDENPEELVRAVKEATIKNAIQANDLKSSVQRQLAYLEAKNNDPSLDYASFRLASLEKEGEEAKRRRIEELKAELEGLTAPAQQYKVVGTGDFEGEFLVQNLADYLKELTETTVT